MKLLISIIILMIGQRSFAQKQYISFLSDGSNNTSIDAHRIIEDYDLDGMHIEYKFSNALIHTQLHQGKTFYQFYINDFTQSQELGKPMLPVHTDLIFIPKEASIEIQLIDSSYITYNNFNVLPYQGEVNDKNKSLNKSFQYDSAAYKSKNFFPNKCVQLKKIITIRGLQFALIEVRPIHFQASSKKLRVYSTIKYAVKYVNANTYINYSKYSSHFLKRISNGVLNSRSLHTHINDYLVRNHQQRPADMLTNYLILCPQKYLQAADSLAKWKRQLGYRVKILSKIHWNTNTIKQQIKSAYNNPTNNIEYVSLIGDQEDLPAKIINQSNGQTIYSDLYFSRLDDSLDYFPDVACGRLSVSSKTEALNVVDKIIHYEKEPPSKASFYSNAALITHFNKGNNHEEKLAYTQTTEKIRTYLSSKHIHGQRIYSASHNSNPYYWNNDIYSSGEPINFQLRKPLFSWTGNTQTIKSAIDKGKFILFYRSKSTQNAWSSPLFSRYQIRQLVNYNSLPVIISLAGNDGDFSEAVCFSEELLRIPRKGAVALFSNSGKNISGMNNALGLSLIDALWPNPGLMPNYHTTFSSGIAPNRQALNLLGDIKNQAIFNIISIWGANYSNLVDIWQSFTLFGDPAMKIWTQQPQPTQLSYNHNLNCHTDSCFTFSTNVNGLATLMIGDSVIARRKVSVGTNTLKFNSINGKEAILTISNNTNIPLTKTIKIVGNCPFANFNTYSNTSCITDSFLITNLSNNTNANFVWDFGAGANPKTVAGFGPYYIHFNTPGNKTIHLQMIDSTNSQSIRIKHLIVDSLCIQTIPNNNNRQTTSCTGILTDNGGLGDYSNNTTGSYTISPPNATAIELQFLNLDLIAGQDKINIYDGPNTNAPLLLSLSGQTIPTSNIISSGGSITIQQLTDSKDIASGFKLRWHCISAPSTPNSQFGTIDTLSCRGMVHFYDHSQGGIQQWFWNFGDGETSTQQHPIHHYKYNGNYTVSLKVSNTLGADSIIKHNYIQINRPPAPIIDNALRCHGGSLTFNTHSGTSYWYNQSHDLLATDSIFTTPFLQNTHIYYVENQTSNSISVGKANETGSGYFDNNTKVNGLVFNVYHKTKLISVDIISLNQMRRTIALSNNAGEQIYKLSVILHPGKNTIFLNWILNRGISYQLEAPRNSLLYCNNGAVNYPYKSQAIEIVNSILGNGEYAYFYNWKCEAANCISPQTEVKAIISDTLKARANFKFTLSNLKVNFINKSHFATSYYWDFGDGDFSLERNPKHRYTHNGVYRVKLIAANACGQTVYSTNVTITNTSIHAFSGINKVTIYPNPASSTLHIKLSLLQSQAITITLKTPLGQSVKTLYLNSFSQYIDREIDLTNLAIGVYILEIKTRNEAIRKKIIIRNQ